MKLQCISGKVLNMLLLESRVKKYLWISTQILCVGILSLLLNSCGTSGDANLPQHRKGELIVKFRSLKSSAKIIAELHATPSSHALPYGLHRITLQSGKSVTETITELKSNPDVLYAEPNYIARKAQIPNDPNFAEQWGMSAISAPQAWDSTTGSSSIIIATLDTGIDYRHPDLVDNLWINSGEIVGNGLDDDGNGIADDVYGISISGGVISGNPMDDDTADTHGTHVAGIIGATGNNSIGVAGVNWHVRLMAIKFLHGPLGEGDLADAVTGMAYAVEHKARVINCSFEIPGTSQALSDAITDADNHGVLIVSAAGNSGSNIDRSVVVPASIRTSNNIAVAATTQNDTMPSWSNYGQQTVDLAAPGGMNTGDPTGILSTVSLFDKNTKQFLRYRTTAGTSMAAPHVAGVAALVWAAHPELTHHQVRARIMNGVDKLSGLTISTITGGRLNAAGAISAADLPAIFSVYPATPSRGETITIHGANFGTTIGTLSLGETTPIIVSWSDTLITATVPSTAVGDTLTVNNSGSGLTLPVSLKPLILSMSATPTSGSAPLDVNFSVDVNSPDSDLALIEWDFGNGTFTALPEAPAGLTAHMIFTEPGNLAIRVRATDQIGRSAVATTQLGVTATSSTSASDNRCFIATAAYGSPLHPRVAALRTFRDSYLVTNRLGRLFVAGYYSASPPLAHIIARHPYARSVTRTALKPLIWFAELTT